MLASVLPGDSKNVQSLVFRNDSRAFGIGPFSVPRAPDSMVEQTVDFSLQAPTTLANAVRVLRACQLPKAILLEGSPGVGKTSLVQALAAASGRELCRINLSEQTDLIDLFGSDLPVVGGRPGEFAWRDAAFLTALRRGDWVLLDEMNLASQAILEGLNAVLDHRGTVYIPELGRSFEKHPAFRVFAAQNPVQQGGGRKGLPKSFLNRFTKVYVMEHTPEDLLAICSHRYPTLPTAALTAAISFNSTVSEATAFGGGVGRLGSPWEFNLRDIMRWLQVNACRNGLEKDPSLVEFGRLCYLDRFRSLQDRKLIANLMSSALGSEVDVERQPWLEVSATKLQIGHSVVRRGKTQRSIASKLIFVRQHLSAQESLLKAVEMGWLVILSGQAGCGKRSLIRLTADMLGVNRIECNMHSAVDTMEMLGSFEQTDGLRALEACVAELRILLQQVAASDLDVDVVDTAEEWSHRLCLKPDIASASAAFEWLKSHHETGVAAALEGRLAELQASHGSTGASFDWVDGPLVQALRNGDWFVINDANLCAPSVLDRLNSLCEFDGSIVLTEKGGDGGAPELIKPHPNFRLFMTFDPKHGELSRAMRNRGLEIHLTGLDMHRARVKRMPTFDESGLERTALSWFPAVMGDSGGARLLHHVPELRTESSPLTPAHLARALGSQEATFFESTPRYLGLLLPRHQVFCQIASDLSVTLARITNGAPLPYARAVPDPANLVSPAAGNTPEEPLLTRFVLRPSRLISPSTTSSALLRSCDLYRRHSRFMRRMHTSVCRWTSRRNQM
jgi:midasin